mgnify:CR=1 FL=1
MQLLSWLSRKPAKPTPEASPQGFHLPAKATALLQSPLRQQLLENIWRRASLSRAQFNTLYLKPLERYAELVQLLPASENHHHAHLGGLLDHGLEIGARDVEGDRFAGRLLLVGAEDMQPGGLQARFDVLGIDAVEEDRLAVGAVLALAAILTVLPRALSL